MARTRGVRAIAAADYHPLSVPALRARPSSEYSGQSSPRASSRVLQPLIRSGVMENENMNNPGAEQEAWVTFVGFLDLPIARSFAVLFTNFTSQNITTVHLLLQSPGGNVSEGIFLFNYFKSLPMNIIAYNCGNIDSASAIAYLGAKKRFVSSNGVFLLHRTKPAYSNIGHLPIMKAVADGVAKDDAKIEAILREFINLTPEQWSVFSQADLTIDAATAVEVGLAHNIGFFSPNGPLYNI